MQGPARGHERIGGFGLISDMRPGFWAANKKPRYRKNSGAFDLVPER